MISSDFLISGCSIKKYLVVHDGAKLGLGGDV